MKRFLSLVMTMILLLSTYAFAESATATLAEMYAEAELLMAQGDYTNAAAKFEGMGSYSDASQMAMYCKAIEAAETLQMFDVAIEAFNQLGDFKDSKQMATYYEARKYQSAAEGLLPDSFMSVDNPTSDLSDDNSEPENIDESLQPDFSLSDMSDEDLTSAKEYYEEAYKKYAELALFKDCMSRLQNCTEMLTIIKKLL